LNESDQNRVKPLTERKSISVNSVLSSEVSKAIRLGSVIKSVNISKTQRVVKTSIDEHYD